MLERQKHILCPLKDLVNIKPTLYHIYSVRLILVVLYILILVVLPSPSWNCVVIYHLNVVMVQPLLFLILHSQHSLCFLIIVTFPLEMLSRLRMVFRFQNLILINMNKKDFLIIILKVVIYACTLLLGVLGVTSLASCSVSRDTSVVGKATIITSDTTYVLHNTFLKFKSK